MSIVHSLVDHAIVEPGRHLPACGTSWNGDIPCVLVHPGSIRDIMFF